MDSHRETKVGIEPRAGDKALQLESQTPREEKKSAEAGPEVQEVPN